TSQAEGRAEAGCRLVPLSRAQLDAPARLRALRDPQRLVGDFLAQRRVDVPTRIDELSLGEPPPSQPQLYALDTRICVGCAEQLSRPFEMAISSGESRAAIRRRSEMQMRLSHQRRVAGDVRRFERPLERAGSLADLPTSEVGATGCDGGPVS